MTAAQSSILLHLVASPSEISAFDHVAHRLAQLARPTGDGPPPALEFAKRKDWSDPPRPGAIVLASMSVHLEAQPDDGVDLKELWLDRIQGLQRAGCEEIFLMTVFPLIAKAERRADPVDAAARLQHIRWLNLMAIELSHETGVSILDVARWFSAIGGDLLQTDYRATGRRASQVIAELTLFTILSAGTDRFSVSLPYSQSTMVLDKLLERFEASDTTHV